MGERTLTSDDWRRVAHHAAMLAVLVTAVQIREELEEGTDIPDWLAMAPELYEIPCARAAELVVSCSLDPMPNEWQAIAEKIWGGVNGWEAARQALAHRRIGL